MPETASSAPAVRPNGPSELNSSKLAIAPFVAMGLVLAIVTSIALLIQPTRVTRAAKAEPVPVDVALIGDSITDQARPVFIETLAPLMVDIEATPGRKLVEQLEVAREVANQRPRRAIINLGSNDVLLDEPPDVSVAALQQMVAMFPTETCLQLVTVNESFFAPFPGGLVLNQRSRAINAEIRRLAQERRYGVIDWAAVIARARDAQPPEVLTADTVHPNAVGQRRLADSYRESLARSCP